LTRNEAVEEANIPERRGKQLSQGKKVEAWVSDRLSWAEGKGRKVEGRRRKLEEGGSKKPRREKGKRAKIRVHDWRIGNQRKDGRSKDDERGNERRRI